MQPGSDIPLRVSAANRFARSRGERGVTLVEVLVTLAITALASALIVATARPADPLRTEAEQLSRTLEQLDARARISGRPVGLVLDAAGYQAVAWSGGAWSAMPGRRHALKGGVVIRVDAAPPPSATQEEALELRPTLAFDPLGHSEIVPVVLESRGRELVVEFPARPAGTRS